MWSSSIWPENWAFHGDEGPVDSCLPVLYLKKFVYWKLPSCPYYGIQDSAFVYCRCYVTGCTAEWSSLLNSKCVYVCVFNLRSDGVCLHCYITVVDLPSLLTRRWCNAVLLILLVIHIQNSKYYCRHPPLEWICFKVVVTWTCCCEWVSEWVRVEV